MMTRFAFALVLLGSAYAGAAEEPDGEALGKVVAPFVDDRTVGVVHLDVEHLNLKALVKVLTRMAGLDPKTVNLPTEEPEELLSFLRRHGVTNAFVVLSLTDLPTNPPFAVLELPARKGGDEVMLVDEFNRDRKYGPIRARVLMGRVVLAGEKTMARLAGLKPAEFPELGKALAGSGPGVVRLVLVMSPATRGIFEEVMPQLPRELGGGSVRVFTRGVKWGSVALHAPENDLSLRAVVQADTKETAQKIAEVAQKGVAAVPPLKELSETLSPRPEGDRVVLAVSGGTLAKVVMPALLSAQEANTRVKASYNLKRVGLAMHNYHDSNGSFPAYANHVKGKPMLSWRVHVLPYLDQLELYKQFKLDEPWDSEHNKKLVAKMPEVYAPRNRKLAQEGKTTIIVPHGKGLSFEGDKGVQIPAFEDGTSNTILAVEAGEEAAVIWTKPGDLEFDPDKPLQGLLDPGQEHFLALFADGSVQTIHRTINVETLIALFTRAGAEAIGDF